ncbi:hypothetical protein FRAHR75_740004 [Frankia sp. Hr75.2]|nr:hypothetical protein FRAHR75_740004 [Frankia sp. Hr75.2]
MASSWGRGDNPDKASHSSLAQSSHI